MVIKLRRYKCGEDKERKIAGVEYTKVKKLVWRQKERKISYIYILAQVGGKM